MVQIDDAIDDFITHLEGMRKSNNTVKSYHFDLKDFANYIQSKKKSTKVSEVQLKRTCLSYLDSLRSYADGKEYATSTLNRKRIAMRKFITFLYNRDYIGDNFGKQIELIKNNSTPEKDVLEDAEIIAINEVLKAEINTAKTPLQLYKGSRNRFIILLFIYTGVRVSELVNLKWTSFDLLNKTIFIEKGKGNKPRTIPIHPQLEHELNVFRSISYETFKKDKIFSGYMFFRDDRNVNLHISTKQIRKIIVLLIERIESIDKHISPHNLRHTFASHSLKNKMSITTLAGILGHSRTSITLDTYAHIINEQQKHEEMRNLNYPL